MTRAPSLRPLFAALMLGAGGLLILGAQPLLYGAYVHDGTISEAQLGFLASVEIAAIAAGSAIGIGLSRTLGLRMTGLIGIALLVTGNLAWPLPLFAARLAAGSGGGLLVALAAQLIARQPNVNRPAGAFLFLQASTQYLILQWFSVGETAASAWPVQVALAALVVATAPLVALLPTKLSAPAANGPKVTAIPAGRGLPPLSGWLALFAAGLFSGAAVGIWVYLGLWFEGRGVSAPVAASMLAASMVGQIIGALLAAWIGERGHSGVRVILMAGLMLASVGALTAQTDIRGTGMALAFGYGLVWMIATPALTGFVLEADASRRSLPFVSAAQLGGAAILPPLAGQLLDGNSLDTIMLACGSALLVSLVFLLCAIAAARRNRPGRA